jgi:hypothetical protein
MTPCHGTVQTTQFPVLLWSVHDTANIRLLSVTAPDQGPCAHLCSGSHCPPQVLDSTDNLLHTAGGVYAGWETEHTVDYMVKLLSSRMSETIWYFIHSRKQVGTSILLSFSLRKLMIIIFYSEEQHRQPSGQAVINTVVVRLGGGSWSWCWWADVVHFILCFLGEASCLIPSRDLLDATTQVRMSVPQLIVLFQLVHLSIYLNISVISMYLT